MINQHYLTKLGDEIWMQNLVDGMWKKGYVVLPQFLSDEGFAWLLSFVLENKATNTKGEALKGTPGYVLGHSEEFMKLFNGLHKARMKKEGKPYAPLSVEAQTVGLPYKDARDGKKTKETPYHFDGAYVNATLALIMPPTGGELIAFPNIRRSRYSFVTRVYARALRHTPFLRGVVPHVIARTVPNDLCLFFGDRTFHGVEPIENGERLILTINAHW